MPIQFDIVDNALMVRPTDLVHREFNAIWEADKTKDKREAHKHLIFVYTLCDVKSDYFENEYTEKLANCKENAYGDRDHAFDGKWAPLVDAAVAKYEKLNENAAKRALETIDRKIDQFRKLTDDTVPILEKKVEFGPDGKKCAEIEPNIGQIKDALKAIEEFEVLREKTEARIAKNPQGKKNRAGAAESLLESGRLGPKPIKSED
jgi:hypothetical protein